MKLSNLPVGLRMRVIIAGLLLAGAVVLFAANHLAEKSTVRIAASSTNAGTPERIDAAIDTVLRRHGIPRERVTSWRLRVPGTGFSRVERRVIVPPEFISLDFNLALSRELDRYHARVIATERTKESTVTIHIVVDGKTTQSVTFITKRDIH